MLATGHILQIRIWLLPKPTDERPHGLKYSLFFGRPGERIVGYDNELGKATIATIERGSNLTHSRRLRR